MQASAIKKCIYERNHITEYKFVSYTPGFISILIHQLVSRKQANMVSDLPILLLVLHLTKIVLN